MQLHSSLDCMITTVWIWWFVGKHFVNSILKNLNSNYIVNFWSIKAALLLFNLVLKPDGLNYFENGFMKNWRNDYSFTFFDCQSNHSLIFSLQSVATDLNMKNCLECLLFSMSFISLFHIIFELLVSIEIVSNFVSNFIGLMQIKLSFLNFC